MYIVVSMVLIPVVNEHDKIIGYKERSEITINDIYRVAWLRITNENDEILLKQRSFHKKNDPGKWEIAVSWTVEGEESYYENILHETEEELGVTLSQLHNVEEWFKDFFDDGWRFFGQVYRAHCELPATVFRLEEWKAVDIKWRPRHELEVAIKTTPSLFVPSIKILLTI